MKRRAIIVDIDGTIVDSTEAIKYLNGEKDTNNYPVYFKMLDKVSILPKTLTKIKTEINTNDIDDIIFLTSRNCEKYASFYTMQTVESCFKEYLGDIKPRINVVYRALNDETPSKDMKVQKIESLARDFDIVAVFEDEPAIVEAYINMSLLDDSKIYCVTTFPWFDYSIIKNETSKRHNLFLIV